MTTHTGQILTPAQIEVIDIIFKEGQIYKHCCVDGKIFAGDYETPLVDLEKLIGSTQIPREFLPYAITSGYCPRHRLLLQECSDEGLTQEEVDYLLKHEREI